MVIVDEIVDGGWLILSFLEMLLYINPNDKEREI